MSIIRLIDPPFSRISHYGGKVSVCMIVDPISKRPGIGRIFVAKAICVPDFMGDRGDTVLLHENGRR